MPWISVYDTVDGPKLRDLYKEIGCSKFEAVGILNFLWFWGLKNADKNGQILNADKEDVARYLYGVGSGSNLDTARVVDALMKTGWIDQTSEGLYIHDWEEWQEQWYKAIERRESDAKRKRESRRRTSDARDKEPPPEEQDVPRDSPEDSPQDNAAEKPDAPKYGKEFEEFWKAYPRKIGKGEAYRKYQARRKDGYSDAELLMAAKNYATSCKRQRTDPQYIKHAKTFLSDSLPFADFIPKEEFAEAEKREDGNKNPFKDFGGEQ